MFFMDQLFILQELSVRLLGDQRGRQRARTPGGQVQYVYLLSQSHASLFWLPGIVFPICFLHPAPVWFGLPSCFLRHVPDWCPGTVFLLALCRMSASRPGPSFPPRAGHDQRQFDESTTNLSIDMVYCLFVASKLSLWLTNQIVGNNL